MLSCNDKCNKKSRNGRKSCNDKNSYNDEKDCKYSL